MSRFAALLDRSRDRTDAARRIEADLARRTKTTPRPFDCAGARLWQAGTCGAGSWGPLTLTGNLALTDLADLRGALAADPGTTQADLVLAAWQRWGPEALDRFHGAFAFVLWDARSRRLTVVRDRFGVKPLAYAATPQRVVVAGDLSTVLAGLDTAPDIDRDWVAGFLSEQTLDAGTTAWHGVSRLPPGHLMTVDADGRTSLRAWYRLERSARPDPGQAGPALQAALRHATVEACAAGPTATMLSGGLDSSTLALLSIGPGVPAPCPRPALSLRYCDPDMDEGPYIRDVLRQSGNRLVPVSLPGKMAADELFDIDAQLDWQDQPVFAPGLTGTRRLCRAVAEQGCVAVLNGHGGDEIIGGTPQDIALIAQEGRWPLALSLAVRQARFTGEPVGEAVAGLLASRGRRGFGRLGRWMLGDSLTDPQEWRALVNPDLVRDSHLVERIRASLGPHPEDRTLPEGVRQHAAMLTGPLASGAFETLDRAAQAEGVTQRYPFFDHRVAELCIWQPERAKVAGGRPRDLLREATRGVLPESVRLRRDKTDFIQNLWTTLRQDPQGRLADFRSDPGPLQGWVNADVLRADATHLARSADPDSRTAFRLWRALWLAAWLDRIAAAPRACAAPILRGPAPLLRDPARAASAAPGVVPIFASE